MESRALVAVLPTLHSYHEDPDFKHYSYGALRKVVVVFGADILCGEVRPRDWKKTKQGREGGYCGPPEYRKCLIPLCQTTGIRFEPIDSYSDADVGIDKKVRTSPAERYLTKVELTLARRSEFGVNALTDPALVLVIRAIHELARENRPELESRLWDRRNERICRSIAHVAQRNPSKRILVTIGLDHLPFIQDGLSAVPDLKLVSPFAAPRLRT